MFEFAEVTKDMTASEILNYYRNLYYAEPQVTERGIVANAVNDFFADVVPKSEVFLASSDAMKMLIECHGYALTHDEDVKRDVAMEIFAEIEKLLHSLETPINKYWVLLPNELAELKKKYTEEQE